MVLTKLCRMQIYKNCQDAIEDNKRRSRFARLVDKLKTGKKEYFLLDYKYNLILFLDAYYKNRSRCCTTRITPKTAVVKGAN